MTTLQQTIAGLAAATRAALPPTTAWMSKYHQPVQIGVYLRRSHNVAHFAFFDGESWLAGADTPAAAAAQTRRSLNQSMVWCGLVLPAAEGYLPYPIHPLPHAAQGPAAAALPQGAPC